MDDPVETADRGAASGRGGDPRSASVSGVFPAEDGWHEALRSTRNFLRRVVGIERADDLASDSMLTLLEYAGRRTVRRPISFALRVAWNKAVDRLRRDGGRPAQVGESALAAQAVPDPARIAELRDWINTGIQRLDAADRALLLLRYERGCSYREVARELGIPTGTVGSRLHEARRRLVDALREADEPRGFPLVLAFLPVLKPGATTLGEALGVAALPAAPVSSAFGWWVLFMSKRMLAGAALLLIGLGGLAWWMVSTSDGNRIDEASAVVTAHEVAPPDVPPAAGRSATPIGPITPKPFDARAMEAPADGQISGRVVDPEGNPVAGARVHFATRGVGAGFDLDEKVDGAAARRAVMSASDGTFSVAVDGLGSAVDITASAAGFAPAILEDITLSDPPIEIRMSRGITVQGTVKDLRERPIPGATVAFRGLAGRGRIRSSTTTDERGAFTLALLPLPSTLTLGMATQTSGPSMGEAHLLVTAAGFAPARVGVTAAPGGGSGTPEPLEIHLAHGGVVEGVVRTADGNAVVADAEVVVWTMEGLLGTKAERGVIYRNPFGSRIIARTKTDGAGHYRITDVPAPVGGIRILSSASIGLGNGRMKLGGVVAYKAGFAPAGSDLGTPNSEGEVQTIDLGLNPAAVVTGRVVDQNGTALAGVRVFCVAQKEVSFGMQSGLGGLVPGETGALGGAVLTDADGRFRHETVPVMAGGALHATAFVCGCDQGLGHSPPVVVTARQDREVTIPNLVIERRATRLIEGDVHDEGGRPVAGARIAWGKSRPTASAGGADLVLPTYSDRDGRFKILVPPPEDPAKPATGVGAIAAKAVPRGLEVTAHGHVTALVDEPPAGERVVVVLRSAATVRGSVTRTNGSPIGGAEVRALAASLAGSDPATLMRSAPLASAKSEPSGAFVLDVSSAEPVLVIAYVSGEGPVLGLAGPLNPPARDVQLTIPVRPLAQGLSLMLSVVDAETSAPWTDAVSAMLSVISPAGAPSALLSAAMEKPGVVRFPSLAPGKYDLRVTAPGAVAWTMKDVVVDESTAAKPILVRLGGGAGISGMVVTPAASDARDGVDVEATNARGETAHAWTGADGAFSLRGLAPGTWELTASRVRATGGLVQAQQLTVEVGTTRSTGVQIPLVQAVKTTVVVFGTPQSSTDPTRLTLEDPQGRRLAGRPLTLNQDQTTTCDFWTAPGPLSAVVRRGTTILATAPGTAGTEIQLTLRGE